MFWSVTRGLKVEIMLLKLLVTNIKSFEVGKLFSLDKNENKEVLGKYITSLHLFKKYFINEISI